MHRYDKSLSTLGRGAGQMIEAPILAYLIETANGRILFDVGCDHAKIADPALRARHYDAQSFAFGAPDMQETQRIPHHLARLGLRPQDVDVIFLSHLHFDHAGGLRDLRRCGCGAELHVQHDELEAARSGEDAAVFAGDLVAGDGSALAFEVKHGEYEITKELRAVSTPGHTAGHMSLWIELPQGAPVLLCGDAADLQENLDDEIAPGGLWRGAQGQAVASIRKLKRLAHQTGARLWPNHDLAFYRALPACVGSQR
jgi:N-acyl homoserine lactone hydrolase